VAPRRLSLAERRRMATEVAARLKAVDPEPKTELYFKTPFQLVVSVMLSAQTTDKMVNACMRDAYDRGFGPDDVLGLGEAGVLAMIRRVGLAPTKSRRMVELARLIKERGGEVPRDREALEALPGVGRKTASVVLAELYGEATIAVDTHVFRVSHRLGLSTAKTAEQCEQELLAAFDASLLPAAHHWLILHGRYTCKAAKPLCGSCVLADLCPSLPRQSR
jgi:endonuclease-3